MSCDGVSKLGLFGLKFIERSNERIVGVNDKGLFCEEGGCLIGEGHGIAEATSVFIEENKSRDRIRREAFGFNIDRKGFAEKIGDIGAFGMVVGI